MLKIQDTSKNNGFEDTDLKTQVQASQFQSSMAEHIFLCEVIVFMTSKYLIIISGFKLFNSKVGSFEMPVQEKS